MLSWITRRVLQHGVIGVSGHDNLGGMKPSNTRMTEEADDRTEWARVFGAEAQVISIDTPLNGLVMKAIYTDESAFSTVP